MSQHNEINIGRMKQNVLIICFSGISNVAAIVPLLDALDRRYPDCRFTVLSRTFLRPLFDSFAHVEFVGADIRRDHSGLRGAYKLFNLCRRTPFDVVIDLQDAWRTRVIRRLFRLHGTKTVVVDKQRREMRKLVKQGALKYRPLKTIFERYAAAFAQAGFTVDYQFEHLPSAEAERRQRVTDVYGTKTGHWIGIAPFSIAHGKTLPFRKMKNVIRHFDTQPDTQIFLFGAGEMENELLSDWQTIFTNVHAVHTSLRLDEELALMEQLDVMVTMDSGNMHLAALTATPVVSIWGATHPYAGFAGWHQTAASQVGVDFSCRPCTAHGDRRCKYGDYRCLESIPSAKIIERIEQVLEK